MHGGGGLRIFRAIIGEQVRCGPVSICLNSSS